jgi:predicted metal-dependent hydrolase
MIAPLAVRGDRREEAEDLLEYVIAHEIVHLLEPTHSERFVALMTKRYPARREAHAELSELPLVAEAWD